MPTSSLRRAFRGGDTSTVWARPCLGSIGRKTKRARHLLIMGLRFTSAGTHSLKGFEEPVELFQVDG